MKPIGMCRACGRGGSPDPTKTAAPKRTSQRAERAIRQRARTRAEPQTQRNLKNGEAPVKYELTGASCHLRTEARGWRRPIKCLLGPLGNRWSCLFLVIGVS